MRISKRAFNFRMSSYLKTHRGVSKNEAYQVIRSRISPIVKQRESGYSRPHSNNFIILEAGVNKWYAMRQLSKHPDSYIHDDGFGRWSVRKSISERESRDIERMYSSADY